MDINAVEHSANFGFSANESNSSQADSSESVLRSADFPGDNNFLLIEDDTNLDPGGSHQDGDFTITGFIYPEDLLVDIGDTGAILSKGAGNDATDSAFQIWAERTGVGVGRVRVTVSDGSNTFGVVSANGSIADDSWTFFEVTYDGSSKILSLNLDRGTPATQNNVEKIQQIEATFAVGGFVSAISSFKGQISLIGIWDRVLSTEELDAVYNGGNGVLFTNLPDETDDCIVYYQLDEVSGNRSALGVNSNSTLVENGTVGSSSNVPS